MRLAAAAILSLAVVLGAQARKALPYLDPSLPIEQRVDDLLSRMTLHEKVLQLQAKGVGRLEEIAHNFSEGSVGAVHEMDHTAAESAEIYAELQRYLSENDRLGIPVIPTVEGIQGILINGCTLFPHALAQGSTFNPGLIRRMTNAAADEARVIGVRQVLSPVFDIARELRWGRVEETYGEDPYLIGEMGVAFVSGYQDRGVTCMPKHFVAHGSPAGGLNCAHVAGGDVELYNIYLYPFRRVIEQCHPWGIMTCYSAYSWTQRNTHEGVNLRQAITDRLGSKIAINYAEGCDWWSRDTTKIAEAVDAANASDLAIVAIGTRSTFLGRGPKYSTAGEGFDLSSLELSGVQQQLLEAVHATGKPMIVVFIAGKPLAMPWVKENADAVIAVGPASDNIKFRKIITVK